MNKNIIGGILGTVMALASITAASAQTTPSGIRLNAKGQAQFEVCSGQEGGMYFTTGDAIATEAKRLAQITNIYTAGSVENLEGGAGLIAGRYCDFIFTQRDAIAAKKAEIPNVGRLYADVATLGVEMVYVITTEKGGITKFDELVDKHKRITTVSGSGAEITLLNFGKIVEKYQAGKGYVAAPAEDWDQALTMLNSGQTDAIFYVAAVNPNNQFLKKIASAKGKYFLAHLKNKDLVDSGLYRKASLNNDAFGNMQGFFDTDTLVTDSVFMVKRSLHDANRNEPNYRALMATITRTVQNARNTHGFDKWLKTE